MKEKTNTTLKTLLVVVILFTVCAGCNTGPRSTLTVKVGLTHGKSHSFTQALERFGKEVEEKTSGRYRVKVFHSSQLGGEREMQEMLAIGSLDISLTGLLNTYEPLFSLLELPYLYKSREHVIRVNEGPVMEHLAASLESNRIKLIGFYENGYRHITNSMRPVNTPRDLEGLLIRTPENPAQMETMKALGAIPTPMSFSELYTSLLQGVVDGQENPLQNIWFGRLYEAQPYLAKTYHIYNSVYVIAGTRFWKSLPAKDREIFKAALRASSRWQLELMEKLDIKLEEQMQSQGVEFTYPDLAEFEKACAPVYETMYQRYGASARQIIHEIKNSSL